MSQCQWGSLENCRREETVHGAGGFGPDGPQSPARGESVKKSVTGMGGPSHNPTCTPQSPGARAGPGHRQYRQMLGAPSSAGGAEKGGEKN